MSAKNSKTAKAARRADRQSRQLKYNPDLQDNTIFKVIPSLRDDSSGTRVYGDCQSCLVSGHIAAMSDGLYNLLLQHKHRYEFLTQEQLDDIEESAKLIYEGLVQKDKENAEQMALAAAAEYDENDWAEDPAPYPYNDTGALKPEGIEEDDEELGRG